MQKITPWLWFDDQAEAAAEFYTAIFPDGKIHNVSRYTEVGKEVHGHEAGTAMVVVFEMNGQKFCGLNGGSGYSFSEAVSFQIECDDQAEVDYYWEALSAGGEESQCGWLKDKFGLSWQIVPTDMEAYLANPDPVKAGKAMAAMLQMTKIDLAVLKQASEA